MLDDALEAFAQIFSPPFRAVLWKSAGLTALILVVLGVVLDRAALSFLHVGPAWLAAILSVLLALGIAAGMILLAPPTASLVAGFFLDDVAALVEREIDPAGPPGRPMPLGPSLLMGLRFACLSILASLASLTLTLAFGLGLPAFFLLNGYLLGREYFELAAMRHMPRNDALSLRRGNAGRVYLAGLIVSGLVAVPVLNFLTPLFATAFMTRLVKRLA